MLVTKGSKIKLMKPMGTCNNLKVGTIYTVDLITPNGNIVFINNNNYGGVGAIAIDEFANYFEIVKEKTKRTWSRWVKDTFWYFDLNGNKYEVPVKYRSDGKKLELRTDYQEDVKNLRVHTCCNLKYGDEFDIEKGLSIADARLGVKLLQKETEYLIDILTK